MHIQFATKNLPFMLKIQANVLLEIVYTDSKKKITNKKIIHHYKTNAFLASLKIYNYHVFMSDQNIMINY